jgi:AAA domain
VSNPHDWSAWWPDTAALPARGPVRLVTGTGTTAYGAEALAREAERVRSAVEGERNHTLNVAAFRMGTLVAAHELALADAVTGLTEAGLAAGLPPREVELLLRLDTTGALTRGQEAPRSVEDRGGHPAGLGRSFLDDGAPRTVPRTTAGTTPEPREPHADHEAPAADHADHDGEAVERSSWYPRDLGPILRGEVERVAPAFLVRDDGAALVYPGRVNGLIGPSESGKSWLLFLAFAQAMHAGNTCLLLDFEDDADGAIDRLRALGVPDELLAERFLYADPDSALDALGRRDLREVLAGRDPRLIGVDGVNAAMSLHGFKVNDNDDATAFSQRLLRPLTSGGAAVLTVDHVTKNAGPDGRAAGAIGAQAKRAMVDGASIGVEVVEPFGRGLTGRLRLTVDKDRHGTVRGLAVGARVLGEAVLASSPTGEAVHLTIEAARPDVVAAQHLDPRRESLLWERISTTVADVCAQGEPPSGNAVVALLRSSADGGRSKGDVLDALAGLVAAGYLSVHPGPKRSNRYRVIRPFREAAANAFDDPADHAHDGDDDGDDGGAS